ncbi:MAG: fdrA domain protein [Candidatus Hydrogenedentota bacterium]
MSKINELFNEEIKVINVGIPTFAEDLKKQGVPVQNVDWRPPAAGNKKIQALLDKIRARR